jgi:uroporphyrinogen decarboxylase
MERLGYQEGLMALLTAADKCHAILARFAEGAGALAKLQASRGVDAVLISSAFAGGGFISRAMYEQFVLPYERTLVDHIHEAGVKAYTHTCGAIGDRLELMQATGIDGIDTMDPPPLGDTDLADAKQRVGDTMFLKGNLDSVNVLLRGTVEQCRQSARERLQAAKAGGGYILSSACSVAPHVPPANLLALREVLEAEGWY